MPLHLNINDLLSARTVETDRIEYKSGWNPDTIYRSICAFANDFDNIGGGYILIGVEEDEATKTAKRPVKGLTTKEIGEIQQAMIGFNNLIKPYYAPRLFVEEVDGKQIMVLWASAGGERPYEVPESILAKHKQFKYFIRKYANSIEAKGAEKEELISLTSNIPFDDRRNTQATLENISLLRVKEHLLQVGSKLADQVGKIPDQDLLAQMELVSGPNEHVLPRNVALMLFAERPDRFFPYTRVEIVEFPEGDAGPFTELEPVTGPVPVQIRRTLEILKDKLVREKVIKPTDRAESIRIASYPYQAIEEIVVNAFYHRDYQQREPIEIRIYPHSIVFLNHGGPDRSIKMDLFSNGQARSRRYRNRRLGEFLKELELTEGRATGIPTILKELRENGSPEPKFLTDDDYTCFEVELFIHPEFVPRAPLKLDLGAVQWDLKGIDKLMDRIILNAAGDIVGDIAGDVVGNQVEFGQIIDNQLLKMNEWLGLNLAGTIARDIARGIARVAPEKMIQALSFALSPIERKEMLKEIGLAGNVKNFNTYIAPLVHMNWLAMTIPDKPTSPNQKYLTTLKGRLLLLFLKQILHG